MRWLLLTLLISCTDNTEEDMRLFLAPLNESGQVAPTIATRTPYVLAMNQSEVGTDTFSWWMVNLASDFPMLTGITKKYIFTWSGSHTTVGSAWGQGDELDLSDFVYGGLMFSVGNSQESPRLYLINGEAFFYEHIFIEDITQITSLYKLTGGDKTGSLTEIDLQSNWEYVDDVLGLDYPDERHDGYLSFDYNETTGLYTGKHMVLPGSWPGGSQYKWSTSPDGITWTREERYYFVYNPDIPDVTENIVTDWKFKLNGKTYLMSYDRRANTDPSGRGTTNLSIFYDTAERKTEYLYEVKLGSGTDELSPTVFNAQSNYYFDELTKTVHIYHCPDEVNLYHSTVDVSNI